MTSSASIVEDGTLGGREAQDNARALAAGVRAYIEYLRTTGVDGFPRAEPPAPARRAPRAAERTPATATPASAMTTTPVETDAPSRDAAADAQGLVALRAEIGDCQRCKLCRGRTNLVFGVGSPTAQLMFVGEGPGRDEDLKGEPFVGRAGQLLTEIITKGMKLRREDVYIANVVKCRPPENRNPEPDEIAACEPFLLRQIEIVQPRVIVALGKFAAQTLLRSTVPITKLRGAWHNYHGIKLMPTLHPAYLLRNPSDKRLVWEDMKQVMAELGLR